MKFLTFRVHGHTIQRLHRMALYFALHANDLLNRDDVSPNLKRILGVDTKFSQSSLMRVALEDLFEKYDVLFSELQTKQPAPPDDLTDF